MRQPPGELLPGLLTIPAGEQGFYLFRRWLLQLYIEHATVTGHFRPFARFAGHGQGQFLTQEEMFLATAVGIVGQVPLL